MTHSNADLLTLKTKKGTFYSEAIMLMKSFQTANRTNYRQYGNLDQKESMTPTEIKEVKRDGNLNFANKTVVKFW